jgi:LPXTG-site transpeptidase (sortase) family protein
VSVLVISFALALIGFAVFLFGLSGLAMQRHQANEYKSFKRALGEAVAPVAAPAEGKPVAILNIPEIGVHNMVVTSGTSSRDLTYGPGERRDSPLPGQAGVSVIYGKRATFGAPFQHLLNLQVGDRFTVTTGQGTSTFRVSSFGTTKHPAPANSANRVVLITANSSYLPESTVSVSADLVSAVLPTGGSPSPVLSTEVALAGDTTSLVPLLLWSQALVVIAIVGTFAFQRWSRWPAVVCMSPIVLAVVWNVYENLAGILPNLY